jgi:hypothetical protein
MSSSLISSTHYHLLTGEIDENQIMDEHNKKQITNYSYFSSSAPTIINSSDLLCESTRWEFTYDSNNRMFLYYLKNNNSIIKL